MRELNREQKEAVLYTDGPALVLAGPGTGKTHTIASRVVYLIKEGHPARDIFVITFTNRASSELKGRISSYLNGRGSVPFVGTFHSLGLEIIRSHLNPAPRLISTHEQAEILRKSGVKGRTEKLLNRISYIKNTLTEPEDEINELYGNYNSYLREHNLIDLDDILTVSAGLLASSPPEPGLHLIIDEYQDINPSAHGFVNAFLRGSRNIFAVGDPDQAIYSFRGSSVRIILEFLKNYPGGRVFNLKRSYRLSKNVIELAEEVIKPNTSRLHKETVSVKGNGMRPKLVLLPDPYREAEFIADVIERQVGGSAHYSLYKGDAPECRRSFSDFAVLVRIKAIMPVIEEKLREKGIPTRKATGSGLIDSPSISALIKRLDEIDRGSISKDTKIVDLLKMVFEKDVELSSDERAMLLGIAENFNSLFIDRALACFKEELMMLKDTDLLYEKSEQVSLLSMHAAKGLEFPVVFIAGAEDGIIPYTKKSDYDLEEERRLFYVALTRAKEEVVITAARKRTLYGKTEHNPPSRFLNLPESLLDKTEIVPLKSKRPKQHSLF